MIFVKMKFLLRRNFSVVLAILSEQGSTVVN